MIRWLAALPAIALIIGTPILNGVRVQVFGLPFLLFWHVLWLVLGSAIMAIIYLVDPANRLTADAQEDNGSEQSR